MAGKPLAQALSERWADMQTEIEMRDARIEELEAVLKEWMAVARLYAEPKGPLADRTRELLGDKA